MSVKTGCSMRLAELSLKNFRKFDKLSIDFDDDLTVLIGGNGAGKSSVLDAAAIAIGAFLSKVDNATSVSIARSDARIVVSDQGGVSDFQEQYPVSVEAKGLLPGNKQACWTRELRTGKGKTTTAKAHEAIEAGARLQQLVREGDASAILPLVACYRTDRLWVRSAENISASVPDRMSRTQGYTDCLHAAARESRLLGWFKKMTMWELQQGKRSPVLSAASAAVAGCFESALKHDGADIASASLLYDLMRDDLVIDYKLKDGSSRKEPLRQLSDGYRSTLSLIADIAYRMAMLNPALEDDVLRKTPGIVLIDEIDLHLHPCWQAHVLADLRRAFPSVQFVVTTHAPTVISSVSRAHLRIVGEDRCYEPASETYGSDANSILEFIMGANSRPEDVSRMFDEFYALLDDGEYALAEAKLEDVSSLIDDQDVELVGARTALFLERG